MGCSDESTGQSKRTAGYKGNLGTSWGPDGSSEHAEGSHDLRLGNYRFPKRDPGDNHKGTDDSCLKRHR